MSHRHRRLIETLLFIASLLRVLVFFPAWFQKSVHIWGMDLICERTQIPICCLELPVSTKIFSGFPVLFTATCCGKTISSLLPCAKSHCLPQRKSYFRKSAHLWGIFLFKIFTPYSLPQWPQFKYNSVPFLMFLIFHSKTVGLPPFTSLYLKLGFYFVKY